jgi:hypothetical protein
VSVKRRFSGLRKAAILPLAQRFFRSGPSLFEARSLHLEEGRVPKHYTLPLLRIIRWQEEFHRFQGLDSDEWDVGRSALQIRRAEHLLMARRHAADDAKCPELDAAFLELNRIRETTGPDYWNVRERRWEPLSEERQGLVRSALERHPCLSEVLKEARRIVEDERHQHRARADRIATEMSWGSQLGQREKLRRNVHTWRRQGLLAPSDDQKTSDAEWRSWGDIRATPEP